MPEEENYYYICELNMCDSKKYYDDNAGTPICSKYFNIKLL